MIFELFSIATKKWKTQNTQIGIDIEKYDRLPEVFLQNELFKFTAFTYMYNTTQTDSVILNIELNL